MFWLVALLGTCDFIKMAAKMAAIFDFAPDQSKK